MASRAGRTQEEELRKGGGMEGQEDQYLLEKTKSFRNPFLKISTYTKCRERLGPVGNGKYMHMYRRNCTQGTQLLRNPCPLAPTGQTPFLLFSWASEELLSLLVPRTTWGHFQTRLPAQSRP